MQYNQKSDRLISDKLIFSALLVSSGLLITVFVAFSILSSVSVFADDVIDEVNITVPVSCTVDATNIAHSATLQPEVFVENIGQTNVSATCNDQNGYAIYAIGYTNNEYGNTNLINTTDSTKTIVTGPNKSGNTSNWSMKLGKGTGESATIEGETMGDTEDFYTDYHIIPSTYTKVAKKTDATSTATAGTSFTTTYGVFTTTFQTAGTYAGQVKYTLVHPNTAPAPTYPVACASGKICYSPNASGVTDSMGDQSITASQTTADLWASNFQRPGYGFAGWTDKYDWVINQNDQNGNGTGPNQGYHIYGPNETISFTAGQYSGSNSGLSLYAVWVPSAGDLQGWTGCSNLNTGQITALTDTRDNQTYAVAKLKDNKCWMVENLRLDNQYTTSVENIAKAQGYNSSFIGLANPETDNFDNVTVSNSLYSIDSSTLAPAITGDYQGRRFPRYNNQNTSNPASNMIAWDNNSNTYSVGNYYTWAAAIADTTHYSSGNHDATSICPVGWHIPTGGTNGEYKILNTEQNSGVTNTSAGLRSYPANFIYSGYFNVLSAYFRSSFGYYWSSTVYGNYDSYGLNFNSSYVGPGTNGSNKYSGQSIRCSL